MNLIRKQWPVLAFLAFLVFAVHFNSLSNEFVADDVRAILNNKNLGNFGQVFAQPLKFLRPLFYFIAYKIDDLNPLPYRMVNIIFHLGTTLLVYFLIKLIASPSLAIFTAGIFAVHPILTESVTWISGGIHAQYSFFLLLSFLTYVLSLSQKNQRLLILSLVSFLLALISSEKAIILPLILFVFLIAFRKTGKKWSTLIPFGMIALIFGTIYLGGLGQRTSTLQSQFYQEPGITNPLVQIPIAVTSYLELIFWPKNLTLYHSEMSFSQGEYLLRLGVFILFLVAIGFAFKKNRQIFFWLSFFLISLLPTLTPLGIAWIVAERYVYLGALGIFVFTAWLIEKIGEFIQVPTASYTLFAILLLILSLRTIVRNADWESHDTLWLATAKTSPSSSQNHNNLGDYYARHGDLEKAVEEFKTAISLKHDYADAYHNLANTYQQMGKFDLAIANYQQAIEFNPYLWQSHQNLAVIYYQQGKLDLARQELQKARSLQTHRE